MTITVKAKDDFFDLLKYNVHSMKENLSTLIEKIMPYDERIDFDITIKKINGRYNILIESEDFSDLLPKDLVTEVKIINYGTYFNYSRNAIVTPLSYRYTNTSGEVIFSKIGDVEVSESGSVMFSN